MNASVIYRPPITCPNCGTSNYFIPNPLTPEQKAAGWTGDNGGHYPAVCTKCGKPLPVPPDIKIV